MEYVRIHREDNPNKLNNSMGSVAITFDFYIILSMQFSLF